MVIYHQWLKPRPVIATLSGLLPFVKLAVPCEDEADKVYERGKLELH